MTRFIARQLALGTALMIAVGTAAAHTGHGHDELGTFAGLVHALSEPDHLLMLLAGTLVASLLAPRLLAACWRLGRALLQALRWRKDVQARAGQTVHQACAPIERR